MAGSICWAVGGEVGDVGVVSAWLCKSDEFSNELRLISSRLSGSGTSSDFILSGGDESITLTSVSDSGM